MGAPSGSGWSCFAANLTKHTKSHAISESIPTHRSLSEGGAVVGMGKEDRGLRHVDSSPRRQAAPSSSGAAPVGRRLALGPVKHTRLSSLAGQKPSLT